MIKKKKKIKRIKYYRFEVILGYEQNHTNIYIYFKYMYYIIYLFDSRINYC